MSKSSIDDYAKLRNAVNTADVTAVRRLAKGGVSVNAGHDWVCPLAPKLLSIRIDKARPYTKSDKRP
jgi:hypothetical protein